MEEHATKLVLLLLGTAFLAALTWWRPMIGCFIYLASSALDYLLSLAGFATSGLFSVGQGMLVLLAAVSLIKWFAFGHHLTQPVRGLFIRMALFTVAMWLSVLFGLWPANSSYLAAVITATTFIPFIFYTLVDNLKRLELLLWALGLGVTLSAVIGCLQFGGVLQTISEKDRAVVDDTRGAVMQYNERDGQSAEGTRYTGPMKNPNGFGLILMSGIPALYYLATSKRSVFQKIVAVASMATCGFALLLTMSRTFIVGFFFFLVLMTFYNWSGNWLKRILYWMLGIVVAVVFGLVLLSMEGVGGRLMAGFEDGGDTSTQARSSVMLGGLKACADHPFFGIGLNNTSVAGYNATGNASHDIVSTLSGELGAVGMLIFGLLVWQAFKLLPGAKAFEANARPELASICSMTTAALIVCLISGLGDPVIDSRPLWIWFGLCAVLNRLHELESTDGEPMNINYDQPPGEIPTAA